MNYKLKQNNLQIKTTCVLVHISTRTLHVSDQQVAVSLVVDPVLESTTLLSRLRVAPLQVDLLPVLHWILHKVPNQLLLQRGVRDVVGRAVNQEDGNNPGGSKEQNALSSEYLYIILKLRPVFCIHSTDRCCVTHSGTAPKAFTDSAAVVYALMYSLAVFWTWHSYRATAHITKQYLSVL